MSRNRDLAAFFGVILVAFAFFAAMIGFFAEHIPAKFHPIVWILVVLVLIFLPMVRGVARWTALGAGIVGSVFAIWLLFELAAFIPPAQAPGPILGLIFAVLFAFFAFRAYRE